MTGQRDLRIDFFRGLALLIVVVDHMEGWANRPVILHWTLMSVGFSDAAEIFVFLSGYVLAIAYAATLARGGLWACLKKAVRRSWQIYVAYLLAASALVAIGALLMDWNPPAYNSQMRIGERPWESLLAAALLRFHPWGFDVLAFYVVILPPMAALFYLRRRAAWAAWSISIGLYLVAQVFPQVNIPRFADPDPWYFNPLGWQLLFFVGTYLGDPLTVRPRVAPRTLLVSLSLATLAVGFLVMKGSHYLMAWNPALLEVIRPIYRLYEWADKTTLGPMRVAHFFALVYLTSLVAPRGLAFWSSRVARPLVISGQHSLEAYAFGLVLSFLGVFAISQGWNSTGEVLVLDLLLCAGSIGFTYGVRWWKAPAAVAAVPVPQAAATGAPHQKSRRPDQRKRTPAKLRQRK